jgi:triosephosphate isomerase
MSQRTLIVGNWKMNLNVSQASLLLHRLHERIKIHRDIEVVLAPNMLALQPLSMQIDRRKFRLAAQNAYQRDDGPFTGEVSFTMLRDLVHYVIVGHSDRRYKFNEDMVSIREKVSAAIRNELIPILCVGETESERKLGETKQVLQDQVLSALRNLTANDIENIVIAYEPVWALSPGNDYLHHETPKPDEVRQVAATIRGNIAQLYGKKAANSVRILYGGSTNASNAAGFLDIEGIDGLLVGGASLNYHEFSAIVDAAFRLRAAKDQSDGD